MKLIKDKISSSGFFWEWTKEEIDDFLKLHSPKYNVGYKSKHFGIPYVIKKIKPCHSCKGPVGFLIDKNRIPVYKKDFEWIGWIYYTTKIPTGFYDYTNKHRKIEITNSLDEHEVDKYINWQKIDI